MAWDLAQFGTPAAELVVRSTVIYLALLLGLRIAGKREIGQFTVFDLVLVLLVANAVQPAMTGPDTSLVGGLLIIATLLFVNWGVGLLRQRSPFLREMLESHPTVIASDGHWILEALRREGVDLGEAEMALREHGVERISAVRLAVLEPDGSISVVPMGAGATRTRRRVRFLRRPP